MSTESTNSTGYETKDVNITKVLLYGVGGIVVLVIIVIMVFDWFAVSKEQAIYNAQLKPDSASLKALNAREAEQLNTYAVLDSKKGVYQIPIERAMEILSEESFISRTK